MVAAMDALRSMRRFSITVLGLLLGLVLVACGRPQLAPAETGTQTTRGTAMVVPVQPSPGDATVEQPTPTAVQPSPVPVEEGPMAARVVVGGNVRNRPTTRGSIVLEQVGVGETVLVRMRLANGRW